MSDSEQQQFDSLIKDAKAFKRWWPIIAGIFVAAGFLITLTMNITSTYDNKIAKKEDTDSIKREVHALRSDIAEIKNSLKDFKNQDIIDKSNIDNKINSVADKVNAIEKHVERKISWVTESYPNGRNHEAVLKPVN